MNKSYFTRPVENLAGEARGYVDAQLENLKLRSVKALSAGTGKIFWYVLLFILAGALLMTLSFAFVLWLGEAMGSYAAAAFIVAGALAVLLLIMFLLRKVLFRGSLVSTYVNTFFPKGEENISSYNELETALLRNEAKVNLHESNLNRSMGEVRSFYSNPALYIDSISTLLGWIPSLFTKKDKDDSGEKKEKKSRKPRKTTKAEKSDQQADEKPADTEHAIG